MIRFGVAGLSFGQFHVKTLANLEGARLCALADPRSDVLHQMTGQYGVKGYSDGLEMIRSGEIDAVTICIPPAFRQPLIEAAVKKGVALFIEKPWAANIEQALDFRRITENSRLPVMTGFSFRFHPAAEKLKELVTGELGPILAVQGSYVFDFLPGPDRWLWDPGNGGGLINENSCHLLDLVISLLGTPVSVKAAGGNWFYRPSEEAAALSLEFSGGQIASILVGGIGAGAFHDFPELSLYCMNGAARLIGRNHSWQELEWSLRKDTVIHRFSAEPEQLGRTRYSDGLTHFMRAIEHGRVPESGIDAGVNAVRLAEAIYKAVRTEKTVTWEELR